MPSILIVCTANQCRSPLAAALLRQRLASHIPPLHWQVESAGTWARPAAPAAPAMQRIAQEWGIDLTAHRAKEVDGPLLARQDLILVMEQGHKEALSLEFPSIASRIHLLSALAGHAYDVVDPIDRSLDDYRATALELDDLIARGLPRLLALAINGLEG